MTIPCDFCHQPLEPTNTGTVCWTCVDKMLGNTKQAPSAAPTATKVKAVMDLTGLTIAELVALYESDTDDLDLGYALALELVRRARPLDGDMIVKEIEAVTAQAGNLDDGERLELIEHIMSKVDFGALEQQLLAERQHMSETNTDTGEVARLEAMLSFDVDENGAPLSETKKAEIEARLSLLRGNPEDNDEFAAMQSLLGGAPETQEAPETQAPTTEAAPAQGVDAQLAAIQAQLAALSSGVQTQQQPVSLADVLDSIDPRDSAAALALFNWLWDNKRFGVVGTLNGGGYLLHYQEPQGTTQAGYIAGGTQGGRFVDAAVEKVKETGAKAVRRGMCAGCMSTVRELEDGSVVLDDEDNPSAACSNGGGPHNPVW